MGKKKKKTPHTQNNWWTGAVQRNLSSIQLFCDSHSWTCAAVGGLPGEGVPSSQSLIWVPTCRWALGLLWGCDVPLTGFCDGPGNSRVLLTILLIGRVKFELRYLLLSLCAPLWVSGWVLSYNLRIIPP